MKKLSGVVVISICLFARTAWGDFKPGSQTLALQGGVSGSGDQISFAAGGSYFRGTGNEEDLSNPGNAIGAQYMYYVHSGPAIGIGMDILYSPLQERISDSLLQDYTIHSYPHPLTVMPMIRLARSRGIWRPYIFAGGGLHYTKVHLDLSPKSGGWYTSGSNERRSVIDDSAASFAVSCGFGADWFIGERLFLGAELRSTYLGSTEYDKTADALSVVGWGTDFESHLTVSNLLIRAGYKFGK